MHKLFSRFVFIADLILGAIAFAALYSSDLSTSLKIFAAVAILLVATSDLSNEILGGMETDLRFHILSIHVWQVFQKVGGTVEEWNEAEANALQRQIDDNHAGGNGRSAIFIALGRFAFWMILGWLFSSHSPFSQPT